ncbi:MAG: hypothetical protein LBT09_13380 [Planctomycetaceae bacterium]|nr:hypothetical protein [Planctomycetaceae bacterium]
MKRNTRLNTLPARARLSITATIISPHAGLEECRDAMHCVSTLRRLRFATPPVMHISSLRD